MPTTTTVTTDCNGRRAHADLGLDCHQLDAGTAVARVTPQTAMRRSTIDIVARSALLIAYAVAGVAITMWALLSRGPFY